jgi:hypothetical protein
MEKARVILFTILLLSALTVAETKTVYDTAIVKQTVIDTVHITTLASDSLMWVKAQKFYSDSFNWILGTIAILIPILVIIVSFAQYFISNSNIKNVKEEMDKIKNETKKEIEMDREILKKEFLEISKFSIDNSLREIAGVYLRQALAYIEAKNAKDHFISLGDYYFFFVRNNMELNKYDLALLKKMQFRIISKYDKEFLSNPCYSTFFNAFNEFKKYCEENNATEHLEFANEVLKKLDEIT